MTEGGAAEGTGRAVPFYCPYCGEQDIRPAEAGAYHCRTCARVWKLSYEGLGEPGAIEEG